MRLDSTHARGTLAATGTSIPRGAAAMAALSPAASIRGGAGTTLLSACCPPTERETCCRPEEKSRCCGAEATPGRGCGCR